jgi:hypothetical protein
VHRVLHFALGAAAGLDDLRVVADGEEIPLSLHTRFTRNALRLQGTLWRKMDRERLSHFATVSLPRDRAQLVSVYGTRRGQTVVVAQSFCVPEQATRASAKLAFQLEGSYRSVAGSPERLGFLGLDASLITSAQEIVHLARVADSYQTAITLTMLHPNVATKAPTKTATTQSLLSQTPEVTTLGSYIGTMQRAGKDYAVHVPVVDANGQPSQIKVGSVTTTFSTIQLNRTDRTFTSSARSAFTAGILGVRDNGDLGSVIDRPLDQIPGDTNTWHQPEGIVITPTPYGPSGRVAAGIDVQVENSGLLHGT